MKYPMKLWPLRPATLAGQKASAIQMMSPMIPIPNHMIPLLRVVGSREAFRDTTVARSHGPVYPHSALAAVGARVPIPASALSAAAATLGDMTAVVHPSIDERVALGKAAREQVSPSGHDGWTPAAGRPDPVALLEDQNVTREPDLVPVRHGRMMVSPFTFYRGAAKIMATDLKDTPTAGLEVQLCGDAHLSNFGVYASPERQLLFDVNDFDETLPGPFEYDVKRLAASFADRRAQQRIRQVRARVLRPLRR